MYRLFLVLTLGGLLAISCSRDVTTSGPCHEEMPSVYYWRTVLDHDPQEYSFIRTHGIGRIYLRMFDVVADSHAMTDDERTVPNASVRIDTRTYSFMKDSMADMEFVPVVFITVDALKAMKGRESVLAANIVQRVKNMASYNSLPNVRELQLDCDWTRSMEESFFALCDSVKGSIRRHQLPWRLSSTIRLHQLARRVPPVDSGVLMVYNTGSFSDPDAANSIIDVKDVAPYMRYLSSYRLHLDVAYPTYSWQLLFRKRQFVGLLNGLNLADTTRFTCKIEHIYVVRRDMPYNSIILREGDMIRQERSEFADIARVRAMIEERLAGRAHSNILYHLDSNNLVKYSSDEIDHILSTVR